MTIYNVNIQSGAVKIMDTLLKEISVYIKARYPIVYLVTSEEGRAEKLLENAGEISKKQCYFWSSTGGFYSTNKFGKDTAPLNALNTIMDYPSPGLFILKDFHHYLEEPLIIRRLRDIAAGIKKSFKTLFIISPVLILPPELLRKGRFDEIFFVDLPGRRERESIFKIHFKKRDRNPDIFDITGLVGKTDGFTGAEIEQLIISGLYRAFAEDREIEDKDIFSEIEETVPLSVTYKEHILSLRAWAENRARAAA